MPPKRLRRILQRMFDTDEFLSPFGIRSLSAATRQAVTATLGGETVSIEYEPGESRTGMFGGNSNWRGPVWFPVNVLLADKLRTYGRYFGDDFTIEMPTGSGNWGTLEEAADLIDGGLTALFRPVDGRRPSDGKRIEASAGPVVEPAPDLLGVLRRRHRRGPRCHAPDRLDRPRRPPAQSTPAPRPAHHGLGLSHPAYRCRRGRGAHDTPVCRRAG